MWKQSKYNSLKTKCHMKGDVTLNFLATKQTVRLLQNSTKFINIITLCMIRYCLNFSVFEPLIYGL